MGGSIRAESEEGQGTQFIFNIETTAAHAINVDPMPKCPPVLVESSVLVVEDNAVGRLRLAEFFQNWGAKTQTAGGVNEAAQLLKASRAPGLAVLNQDVLNQSGGEALLEIAKERKVPSLLLLPPGPESPKPTTKAPHFANQNKPVRTATLVRRLQELFHLEGTPTKTQPPSHTKLSEEIPLTVLLVEDNLVNQKVATRFLDRLGYKSDVANDGVEGVEAVEQKRYDLVLMDLQMPEMDGLTASREIRKRIDEADQPKIVALTANALQGDRELCLEAGMDYYVSKPVKLHELGEVIRRQFANTPGSSVPSIER